MKQSFVMEIGESSPHDSIQVQFIIIQHFCIRTRAKREWHYRFYRNVEKFCFPTLAETFTISRILPKLYSFCENVCKNFTTFRKNTVANYCRLASVTAPVLHIFSPNLTKTNNQNPLISYIIQIFSQNGPYFSHVTAKFCPFLCQSEEKVNICKCSRKFPLIKFTIFACYFRIFLRYSTFILPVGRYFLITTHIYLFQRVSYTISNTYSTLLLLLFKH